MAVPKKAVSLSLPIPLYNKLRRRARMAGRTMNGFMVRLIDKLPPEETSDKTSDKTSEPRGWD
jgi:hypothetical protein